MSHKDAVEVWNDLFSTVQISIDRQHQTLNKSDSECGDEGNHDVFPEKEVGVGNTC